MGSRIFIGLTICLFASISVAAQDLVPLVPIEKSRPISFLQLIVNPSKFQNQSVKVVGYLHLWLEGDQLFLHKEDYLHGIKANSIWFDTKGLDQKDLNRLNNKYVIVEGIFHDGSSGHLGGFNGEITQIKMIRFWSDSKNPKGLEFGPTPPPFKKN